MSPVTLALVTCTENTCLKNTLYMGLSELIRMIIIFVTFCLNKKKKKVSLPSIPVIQLNQAPSQRQSITATSF